MAVSLSTLWTMQDNDTFPFFCKLPTELRLKIWNFNLPQARLVPIRCGSSFTSLSFGRDSPWISGCTSSATIPANLHACAESRAETLKQYDLRFGFARGPGQVFFNPLHDILYFGPREGYMVADSQFHTFMSMCDPAELNAVRRIAISDSLFWIDNTYRSMTAASLTVEILRSIRARLPSVEEVVFIPREEETMSGPDASYIEPTMVHVRIAQQVQAAVMTLMEQMPQWKPPQWRILPLNAFPTPCA